MIKNFATKFIEEALTRTGSMLLDKFSEKYTSKEAPRSNALKMEELEQRVTRIEERNMRVEEDKAWEGSLTRKALICGFTYIAIGAYMFAISVPNPWLNAIIPSVGFLLSTLTLPFCKKIWSENLYNQDKEEKEILAEE